MTHKIHTIAQDLDLIELIPPLEGFSGFIAAWLYRGQISFLVDVGPATTAADLLAALDRLDVRHLDYILLTHIHLDHAGAIGQIAAAFPRASVICHPTAMAHLVDPSRLWEATRKTLGATAEGYGPISAVAENRLVAADQFHIRMLQSVLTPGHASHHVSYLSADYLFVGETGGVVLPAAARTRYMRPATPPRFFLNTALNSLDKLIACRPDKLCYGHFGMRSDGVEMLAQHRRQLLLWEKIIKEQIDNCGPDEDLLPACTARLLKADPQMAGFHSLPPAVQQREKYFITNSIKGFESWLTNKQVQGPGYKVQGKGQGI